MNILKRQQQVIIKGTFSLLRLLRLTQRVKRSASDADLYIGQCIPTRLFSLDRPLRLTHHVRRGLQIDARLFLNIDAVACSYLRCESTECVSLYTKHTGNII